MSYAFIVDSSGNTLEIDCTIKFSTSYSAKTTQKPVGSGITKTDSRNIDNLKIVLVGIISNIPSNYASEDEVEITSSNDLFNIINRFKNGNTTSNSSLKIKENNDDDIIHQAEKFLENLHNTHETFSLFIKDRDEIKDLVLLKYDPEISAETGYSLSFRLEMIQIDYAISKTTQMPKQKEKPKTAEKKDNGKVEASKTKENKSTLSKGLDKGKELISGFFK